MAGPLLRTGPLRHFKALGDTGRPVFSAAAQIRAAIRRQIGPEAADMLAIPQIDETGEIIDWYAPIMGSVVPWTAASPSERDKALEALQKIRQNLLQHAQKFQQSQSDKNGSIDAQVFLRLLGYVPVIPDSSHIYLVGDKPVIVFWGFQQLDAPLGGDAIRDLRPDPAPPPSFSPPPEPVLGAAAPPASKPRRFRWSWLWFLLPLLLLLLLLLGLRSCQSPPLSQLFPKLSLPSLALPKLSPQNPGKEPSSPADAARGTASLPSISPPSALIVKPDAKDGVTLSPFSSTEGNVALLPAAPSPNANETLLDAPPFLPNDAETSPLSPSLPSGETAETPFDSITLHPSAPPPEPGGTQDGLSSPVAPTSPIAPASPIEGLWRSQAGLTDSKTDLPLSVEYRLQNGAGTSVIHRKDGVSCTAPLDAKMTENGGFSIRQLSDPQCSDGTTFKRSELSCTPEGNARARCTGLDADREHYSVGIKR